MLTDEEIRKKYDFILKPIKDLTKNWEVDVSNVLEEYMDEIEKMSFSIDNGSTVINFAEASMLIQGTACVWTRKVEYLYILVRKTLDMIANKQTGWEVQDQHTTTSSDDPDFDDEDEKLLSLDDVSVTSERLMKGVCYPVLPAPLHPPSMLELNVDAKGRAIITEDRRDTVCHTHDFWENRYIPFVDSISVLDQDSDGILHKFLIPSMQGTDGLMMCEENVSSAIQPSSDSVEIMPAVEEMEDECLHDEDSDIAENGNVVYNMPLRSRNPSPRCLTVQSAEIPPRVLDPYEECRLPSWSTKSYRRHRSFRPPISLLRKTRKRSHDGAMKEDFGTISSFLSCSLKDERGTKSMKSTGPLSEISAAKQKARLLLWKLVKKEANSPNDKGFLSQECRENEEWNDHDVDDASESADEEDIVDAGVFPQQFEDIAEDVIHDQATCGLTTEMTEQQISSYEDLVRHHVEMFYSSAQRYKEETALAQRVKQWDETVTPRLEEQYQRPEFDIHRYGDLVLKKFVEAQDTETFVDIVETANTWDICRLFAATLQLINDNNFSVSSGDNLHNSINSMKLTLLSRHRLCNRFDDYATGS